MTDKTFEKYKLVVDEYFINGFNGTKAYQAIYPESSPETASTEFHRILRIPKIETYYTEKQEHAKKLIDISHTQVLQELKNWAYSDITQTISLTPYEVEQLPLEVKRLITKFKKTTRRIGEEMTEETIELHFVSKEKAIEMIAKHIGFFGVDNSQKQPQFNMPISEWVKQ